MKRYSLQGDLRVTRRLVKPLLERARLMKTYEHHRQYFDMLRKCNSAITQLDQKRYCRSAHGNELFIEQLNMQIKFLQYKLDFLKGCGFFHGYGPREIEKDHKRLAQIKSKSVMELPPHEIAERQMLSDRLDALYLHDPETKARHRKDRLSDRAKSARHPLSVSEKQELERLERLYPGESPNYTTTCDSKVVLFYVPRGAYRNRFPNDFAKRLNLETSASILLMVSPYGWGLYDPLREIGYDDIDCTGDVEDAFNRALYFRFDLIIGLVPLDHMLTKHQIPYGSILVQTGDETLLKSGDPKFISPSVPTQELAQRLAQLTKHAQPELAEKRQSALSPQDYRVRASAAR